MKLLLLACFLFLVAASCRQDEASGVDVSNLVPDSGDISIERKIGPFYKEVWMRRDWQGSIGVVLGLKEGELNEFHYWFTSDGGATMECAKGLYHRSATEITLRVADYPGIEPPPLRNQGAALGRKFEFDLTDSLYDNSWQIVQEDDGVFLVSTDDLDNGLWLRPVDPKDFARCFPDGGPFFLQMNPQFEGQ